MSGLRREDEEHLHRAIALANVAVDLGFRPFGSLIVDAEGKIVAEGFSTQQRDRDWTAHAEMNVVRVAGKQRSWDELSGCTLYASGDPCPMCAGAVFWSNIRRVVFAVDENTMRPFRQGNRHGAGILMSCREVLSRAPHSIEIVGPAMVDDAIKPHQRYWKTVNGTEGWV